MRTEVIGKHLEVTDAIRAYAEQKCERLTKVFDGTQLIRVLIEQHKHAEFEVEVYVDVVKHEEFVSHARGSDLYGCIDQATDKAHRQIRDFKEKLRLH